MIKNLRAVLRYFLIWILFFFLERLVFLLFFASKLNGVPFGEMVKGVFYGMWMDVSTAGYFSVLPLLGFIVWWLIPSVTIKKQWICIYFRTLIILSSLITVINLNIYREWGSKVSRRAFEFLLASPGEALASSISSPLLLSSIILIALIATGFWLSKFVVNNSPKQGKFKYKLPVALLLMGLNFLAIRGGWQLAPMNESMAYYSSTPILNHAAVNTEWALLHSLMSGSGNKNPFEFYKKEEAEAIVHELYPQVSSDSTQSILSVKHPNIVLVIMESYTADVVESLDGEKGLNPGIERMLKQGILFDRIYASGDRTDKGVVSVLSAFPTQGMKSIMKENTKQAKLPSLFKSLKALGYQGTYYYGGETEFANMKSYLLNTGCQELIDKSNFEEKDMNSKWGAYDDVVYKRVLDDSQNKKQPFFSTLLTLTNHEPFELPVKAKFKGDAVENKFRSTAYYTDSCLTAFINTAKKYPWYKNTLFVAVADHGHRLPKNIYEIYDAHRYRIPLFFFGEVIKPEYRGTRVSKVGSQTDIAATLLGQIGVTHSMFPWSKDLFNSEVKGHAFYSWENGFGFVNAENKALTFDNTSKSVVYTSDGFKDNDSSSLRHAKAYMQRVFAEFLSY